MGCDLLIITAETNKSSLARPLNNENKILVKVAPTMRPAVGPRAYTPTSIGPGAKTNCNADGPMFNDTL